jgi:hypothetical protein
VNRDYVGHMRWKVALAFDFVAKLATVRSLSESAAAWQQWTNRRIEVLTQDGSRLFADIEELVNTGACMLVIGWAELARTSREASDPIEHPELSSEGHASLVKRI